MATNATPELDVANSFSRYLDDSPDRVNRSLSLGVYPLVACVTEEPFNRVRIEGQTDLWCGLSIMNGILILQ